MSQLEANKRVVQRYLEALGNMDLAVLSEVLTEDFIVDVRAPTLGVSGARKLVELAPFTEISRKMMPDGMRFHVKELTAEENRVACAAEGEAVVVNGDSYCNQYHFLFYFRNGKIYKSCEYLDSKLFERIFGDVQLD